ncbi:hypothetical protein OQA88_8098 [Cercophora sp. LCS_1]
MPSKRKGPHEPSDPDVEQPGKKGKNAESSDDALRFACPFFKRNRVRFSRHCRTFGVLPHRLADITQHFHRHHLIYDCPTCFEIFNKDAELRLHIRERNCLKKPESPHFGLVVTTEQMDRIRKRKTRMKPEDRWNDIWKTLFGEENTTESPFLDPEDASMFSSFLGCIDTFDRQRFPMRPDGPEVPGRPDCCRQTLIDLRNFINHLREQEGQPPTRTSVAPAPPPIEKEQQSFKNLTDLETAQWVHIDRKSSMPAPASRQDQAGPSASGALDPLQLNDHTRGLSYLSLPTNGTIDALIDPTLGDSYDTSWTSLGD